ncbi:DNA-3-methyladenine glycosylase 2 family protein [Herbiconiux liukaitaii]|uniref:DNA-3-methyladenine glycosylase 2 family protein n=1 Tax=Herbiconiux liukaitaii TaxID=3342799 RepID=UPI0035B7D559
MDFEARYRIIQSRDARFDGQFITAVSSTGIYCRPSCPARTPKPANVAFYDTSAAAHEAGYRACKRCLPEAVPGTPAWNLRHDLTARAMRLIGDGLVEREGVDGLALRLGYSPRHLTRVLTQELGAGPLALARAHRAQTARTLLTSTELSMADIAFAAGFRSIRQFNDSVAEVFQLTPTDIRTRHRRPPAPASTPASAAAPGAATAPATAAAPAPAPGTITLTLPYREPYDALGVFTWLMARAIPGIEHVTFAPDAPPTSTAGAAAGVATYTRSLRLPNGAAWFTVRHDSTARGVLTLEAHLTALSDLPVLVARVRRLFDLDADPTAIDTALLEAAAAQGEAAAAQGGAAAAGGAAESAGFEALSERIRATPGIRMPGAVDPDEMLFRAIIGQQITVAAARTLLHRLAHAAGSPMPPTSHPTDSTPPTLLFPTPAQVAEHAEAVLTGPRAKIRTVVEVARALATGDLELSFGADPDDLHTRLTALPGIGPWTAGYLAMRILNHPDILLTGDVALRTGARTLGLPATPATLTAWSAAFTPWRTYLSLHLWSASAPKKPATKSGRTQVRPTTRGRGGLDVLVESQVGLAGVGAADAGRDTTRTSSPPRPAQANKRTPPPKDKR